MAKTIDPWRKRNGVHTHGPDGHKELKPLPDGIAYTWRRDKNRQWLRDADGDRIPAGKYRTRANTNTTPPGKRRHQITATHDTLAAAKQWLADVRTGRIDWTPPAPEPEPAPPVETLHQRLRLWRDNRARKVRAITARGYGDAMKHWQPIWDTPTVEVTREQITNRVTELEDSGLSPRTIQLAMLVLRNSLREAVAERVIDLDPSALVSLPKRRQPEKRSWTKKQANQFLTSTADHRDHALFRLSLLGLRRSELLGLQWGDLDDDTIRVRRGRVVVKGGVTEDAPKSVRSRRDLPLTGLPGVVGALRRLRTARASEALAVGRQLADSDYLACDQAMTPYRPEHYSDLWREATESAGVPALTLHEARHTAATLLAAADTAPEVAARWLGHDPAVYLRTYVHPDRDRVASAGAVLGAALG